MYIVNELRLRRLVDLRGRLQSIERPGGPLQAGEHDRRLRCRNPDTRSTASATGPGIAGASGRRSSLALRFGKSAIRLPEYGPRGVCTEPRGRAASRFESTSSCPDRAAVLNPRRGGNLEISTMPTGATDSGGARAASLTAERCRATAARPAAPCGAAGPTQR